MLGDKIKHGKSKKTKKKNITEEEEEGIPTSPAIQPGQKREEAPWMRKANEAIIHCR